MYFSDKFVFPVSQRLEQSAERDCGVPVFAALAGVSEDELCADLPGARKGDVTVDGWKNWLRQKGFDVLDREGCPDDIIPCAHLVGPENPINRSDFHWIYRDEHGNVHDPSPVWKYMPANDDRVKSLQYYLRKQLTISVSRCESSSG